MQRQRHRIIVELVFFHLLRLLELTSRWLTHEPTFPLRMRSRVTINLTQRTVAPLRHRLGRSRHLGIIYQTTPFLRPMVGDATGQWEQQDKKGALFFHFAHTIVLG